MIDETWTVGVESGPCNIIDKKVCFRRTICRQLFDLAVTLGPYSKTFGNNYILSRMME